HHHLHIVPHLQKFLQSGHDFLKPLAVDTIKRAVQLERFLRREIPPKRILLSHQQTELAFHFVAPLPGNKAEHARLARSRVQQAGKHFEHSSFPGSVRAQESDNLAFLDLKCDLISRSRFVVPPPAKTFHRAPEAALFAVSPIDLRQFGRFNCRHTELWRGSYQLPLQNIVEARQQMRNSLLCLVSHVRETKSLPADLAVTG